MQLIIVDNLPYRSRAALPLTVGTGDGSNRLCTGQTRGGEGYFRFTEASPTDEHTGA